MTNLTLKEIERFLNEAYYLDRGFTPSTRGKLRKLGQMIFAITEYLGIEFDWVYRQMTDMEGKEGYYKARKKKK